jgi:hypothetical protein
MGSIHLPPLSELAMALAGAGGLRQFVETGTYTGQSLSWAARNFDRVWTIEVNADYHAQAKQNVGPLPNVTFRLGDSAQEISRICSELRGPALFWLDAHAGAGFFSGQDDCPLLAELEAVVASPHPHCMLVDDARAFVAPPPPPFDYRKWPALDEIMAVVLSRPGHRVAVISDVLVVVPEALRDVVADYSFRVRPQI